MFTPDLLVWWSRLGAQHTRHCRLTASAALNSLEVSKALTAIALFDILRFPLFVFPTTLTNIVEARVTINRLQAFLLPRLLFAQPPLDEQIQSQ